LQCPEAVALAQLLQHRIEAGLESRRGHGIEHQTDRVVGGRLADSKQSPAIGPNFAPLQATLVGEKRLALREERRKRRKPNIGHAVVHIRPAPRIWKSRAGRAQTA
jgi:hypothetical protein